MYRIREFSAFSSHFQVTFCYMTSLPVTGGHMTSSPVTYLPSPASCSLVGSGMYSIRQFSPFYTHFLLTSLY